MNFGVEEPTRLADAGGYARHKTAAGADPPVPLTFARRVLLVSALYKFPYRVMRCPGRTRLSISRYRVITYGRFATIPLQIETISQTVAFWLQRMHASRDLLHKGTEVELAKVNRLMTLRGFSCALGRSGATIGQRHG